MTTPTPVKQTNKKAWIATIGSLIGAMVPLVAQLAGALPPPYGAILSGIVALIGLVTGKAVHQVSNVPAGMPEGTVLAPVPPAVPPAAEGDPWQ